MCFWNYYGVGGWFIPIIMLGMIVFMVLFMQLFMRFRMGSCCRWPFSRGQQQADDEAFGIVRRRYANGEISKEEFENTKMNLS